MPNGENQSLQASLQNDVGILCDQTILMLLKRSPIDSDCMACLIQLMAVPELTQFFSLLCRIDLTDAEKTGSILADCVLKLQRVDHDIDEVWKTMIQNQRADEQSSDRP